MACAFMKNTCYMGVIVGTGTNACYMEKLENIEKIRDEHLDEDNFPDEMIINTEWGNFGEDGSLDFIRTRFDRAVDEGSINPGKQLFEKMISGMYMGEIVRVVLVELADEGVLFDGDFESLRQTHSFPTKFVSEIENDFDEDGARSYQKTMGILEDIGIDPVSVSDCYNVAEVCRLVSTRAAYLTAAGIATLLKRMNKTHCTVGVDGSVYRFHPTFPKLLDKKIDELLDGKLEFELMLSEDGSGRGAALVAAVATRMNAEAAAITASKNNGSAGVCQK
ncbi:hypothetical protein AB6A40_007959 [Gnathostoma spinigerum]|uniref:Phosphotransferase n=1 Tax=Gnathostoma spinigerum TaxID=75299 RepID=A0ABD6EP03_9BILA